MAKLSRPPQLDGMPFRPKCARLTHRQSVRLRQTDTDTDTQRHTDTDRWIPARCCPVSFEAIPDRLLIMNTATIRVLTLPFKKIP